MPPLWNFLLVAWLAWCTAAYGSSLFRAPFATVLANPLAAVLAATLGVWLAWQAWRRSPRVTGARGWLRPQAWSATSWAGVGVSVVWIALDAFRLFSGRLTSIFGIYIVVALMTGFVPRVSHAPSSAVPPRA